MLVGTIFCTNSLMDAIIMLHFYLYTSLTHFIDRKKPTVTCEHVIFSFVPIYAPPSARQLRAWYIYSMTPRVT